jgi:hypothetical protein
MLADFIAGNREEIVMRYRSKAAIASLPVPLAAGGEDTVLVFIEELLGALRNSHHRTTVPHGDDNASEGKLIVPRVLQYRHICQSITELAMEMNAPINVADFANLDRCFDDAVARAVTESISDRSQTAQAAVAGDSEPSRVFQHEARKLLNTAMLSFDLLRAGTVGLDGSTGRLFYRSLIELRSLVDRIDRDTQL